MDDSSIALMWGKFHDVTSHTTRACAMTFEAGEAIMWQLVQRYTGRVGYQRGVKSEGLSVTPPVIDCSGWTALLLSQAMQAENDAAGRDVFGADDMRALQVWSDRIISRGRNPDRVHSSGPGDHGYQPPEMRDHRVEDGRACVGD
jgi:hypothetical protein